MEMNMDSPISQELLDILACPKCKTPVTLTDDRKGLLCGQCRVVYEIRDGIPVMLIDEAIPLDRWPEKAA